MPQTTPGTRRPPSAEDPRNRKKKTSRRHIKPFSPSQRRPAAILAVLVTFAMVFMFAFGESAVVKPAAPADAQTKPAATESAKKDDQEEEPVPEPEPEPEEAYEVESSIIVQGDRAMEIFYVAEDALRNYGSEINTFAAKVPDSRVFVLLAPTAMEYYAPKDYQTDKHSFVKAMQYAYEPMTAKNITTVNVRNALAKHKDDYIFFRTDHHWTARGAYYAYRVFCRDAHLTPTELDQHETGRIEGFVGSLYRYTNAQALKDHPDSVQYFYPLTETDGKAFDNAAMEGERRVAVISSNVAPENAYLCFIEGDNPIERFNTGTKNGKSIVLIKESYGDAFAPFLMDNYETVWVIDPRKVEMDLAAFVSQHSIDDILFLNYGFALSNPTYKKALTKMLDPSANVG